jgi:hypothetical protein
MTFADALAAWRMWDGSTVVGCFAFTDYCEERGLPVEYTSNWRRFCPMYGGAHITNELERLTRAESAHAARA